MNGIVVDWGEERPERAREMDREARRIADRLGEMGADLVVLFGSRARGQARARSDLDLLAVLPCDPTWTFARRLAEVGAAVDPRLATDLFVYTPEEFATLQRESAFVRRALEEGQVLFRRTAAPPTEVADR